MAATAGFAELIGDFKDAWQDNVVETYRNIVPLLASAQFKEVEQVGKTMHVATRLTYEGGTTFAAAQTTVGDGSSTYVGPRAGQVADVYVEGMQVHARSRITYEAIASSMADVNATGPDRKKAVQAATRLVMDGILQGTLKKLETLMLHGREGIGQLDSANTLSSVVATTYESVSGFAIDLPVSAATWAEAIWAAFEGHTFDLFANTSGLPSGTKLNTATNTLLTGGSNQTGYILIAVNPATPLSGGATSGRVLRFWHSSGTAAAPGTGVIGGWTTPSAGTQDQHICFESGGPANEFVGLGLMAQNQGTLFGVSAAAYNMWKGNLVTSAPNLRLSGLIRYLKTPINFGAQGKTIRAVVPTELFAQFANDESTLRRYASVTGSAENGFDSIKMYLPMQGQLEILGHALQKDGVVTCYTVDEVKRIGAQDVDFVKRGKGGSGDLVMEVADRPQSELRIFAKFAPVCSTPRHMLALRGVTY